MTPAPEPYAMTVNRGDLCMKMQVPDYIMKLKPYKPGKPIEELEREYGIAGSIKLASNENPLGPPESALAAIGAALGKLHRYPDGSGFYLTQKLAEKNNVSADSIVLGNGSDDIIGLLTRAFLKPDDEAIMTQPSFLMYDIMVASTGARSVFVPLAGIERSFDIDLDAVIGKITPRTRMIFLTNPNNPTGTIIRNDDFEAFCARIPKDIVLVIDEAYIEFAADPACMKGRDYIGRDLPVVVLRTFSKAYGLAGIRVGYGIMAPAVAQVLNRVRMPFNVNSLGQVAALAALDDEAYLKRGLDLIHGGLTFLYGELDRLGLAYFKTQSNFFLIDVKRPSDEVFERLLREGVIVRSMSSYGFPEYIRVTVGLPEENQRFIRSLEKVMKP
ncbi:histidinol-phosphate transaminase [Desulfatiferula olefinivorans]